MTTQGWELEVEWRDGMTSWVPLKDLKDSNPVPLAEYAVANKISEERAFAWWVHPTFKWCDRIIKKVSRATGPKVISLALNSLRQSRKLFELMNEQGPISG